MATMKNKISNRTENQLQHSDMIPVPQFMENRMKKFMEESTMENKKRRYNPMDGIV